MEKPLKSRNLSYFVAKIPHFLLSNGKPKLALALFRFANRWLPSHPDVLDGLLDLSLRENQWVEALHWLEKSMEQFPETTTSKKQFQHASLLLKTGAFDQAEKAYQQLNQSYPTDFRGLWGLAQIAKNRKEWQHALQIVSTLIASFPDGLPRYISLFKKNMLIRCGELDKAIEMDFQDLPVSVQRSYRAILTKKNKENANLRFRTLFIVTYGRTGSTLLQGVLNAIDGVTIRGENNQLFYHLFQLFQNALEVKEKHLSSLLPYRPWYGAPYLEQEAILTEMRSLSKTLLAIDPQEDLSRQSIGFKEIRYLDILEDFDAYLNFLAALFPETAFIFNTRNHDHVLHSAWWRRANPHEAKRKLEKLEAAFRAYAKGKTNCYSLTYEDLVARNDRFKGLFAFLGVAYQPEVIQVILDTPHSYQEGNQT